MKVRIIDCIKIGFGFYIGYEIAKSLDKPFRESCKLFRDRIKNGYI